jgi:MarR family 2-MHQ and catechol resistance regulon transcriptional repressor
MSPFQFEISRDGHLRETEVHEAVSALKQLFGEIDPLALEATLMLERTHSLMTDERSAYWSRFGITARRFILLRHLYLAPARRLSMGDIANVLNAGTANATQIVAGMVQDGLVERVVAEDDRRVVFAVITPKGEEVFRNVFTQNAARLKESWTPLTDREMQILIDLLTRLRVHLLSRKDQETARDLSSFVTEQQPETRPRRRERDAG